MTHDELGDHVSTVDLTRLVWRKSSSSGGSGDQGDCVEVAFAGLVVAVRDSKNPVAGMLTVPASSWTAFLRYGH
jgi:uncharacterized protein DUF397